MSEVHTVNVLGRNYTLNAEEFKVREIEISGDLCLWITPLKTVEPQWTEENIIFRSLIVRKEDGYIVSGGLKKFFNYHERPELDPLILEGQINDLTFIEKLDGSCLIVSKYKNQLITRTRGSLTSNHYNGSEMAIIEEKYPLLFDNAILNSEHFSFILEWVTPSNRIIVDYPEVDASLLAVVDHTNYSYLSRKKTKEIADVVGLTIPQEYNFGTADELFDFLTKSQQHMEGFCFYYNGGQSIRKLKTEWYLTLHRINRGIRLQTLLETILPDDSELLPREQAVETLKSSYEHESMFVVDGFLDRIYEAAGRVKEALDSACTNGLPHLSATPQEQYRIAGELYKNETYFTYLLYSFRGSKVLGSHLRKMILHECKKR